MKLIDQYLPSWDFAKSNKIPLNRKSVLDDSILFQVDFSKSRIIKLLFFLRGLSAKKLTLDNALRFGFILLDRNDHEIVLGLIAQLWKLKGNIINAAPDDFLRFDKSDFMKAVWNFRIEKMQDDFYLSTETRIHCTSAGAKRKFSFYWSVIGFFSGVIRNEMLKIIKNELESSNRSA